MRCAVVSGSFIWQPQQPPLNRMTSPPPVWLHQEERDTNDFFPMASLPLQGGASMLNPQSVGLETPFSAVLGAGLVGTDRGAARPPLPLTDSGIEKVSSCVAIPVLSLLVMSAEISTTTRPHFRPSRSAGGRTLAYRRLGARVVPRHDPAGILGPRGQAASGGGRLCWDGTSIDTDCLCRKGGSLTTPAVAGTISPRANP